MNKNYQTDRRNFIKATAIAGVGATLFSPNMLFGKDDRKVRLGFIGLGSRGRGHFTRCLERNDIEIKAICDIDPEAIKISKNMLQQAGYKNVPVYDQNETAYLKLLEQEDIDGVIISTPWLWHTKMAVATMKSGKYAGLEVSAANTLEECWDLVNTYEETGIPVMILENSCYNRHRMAILNMVRQGFFGELIHLECGYKHDLRDIKFRPGVEFGQGSEGEARWRTQHSVDRNGDLYPTHGVGVVSNYININRGNRFVSLTSTASKSRGLHDYIVKNAGNNHPHADIKFRLGDVITTVIKTANEETIVVTHDTNLPRPFSLGLMVQGTEGIWMDMDQKIYIEGKSPRHQWESLTDYMEQYDHPLWKKLHKKAEGAGHGGQDFFVVHAFVEAVKNRAPAPLDAYDAAAWSAVTPLSEQSIANGSQAVAFPDFTRGNWMKKEPIFALNDKY